MLSINHTCKVRDPNTILKIQNSTFKARKPVLRRKIKCYSFLKALIFKKYFFTYLECISESSALQCNAMNLFYRVLMSKIKKIEFRKMNSRIEKGESKIFIVQKIQ